MEQCRHPTISTAESGHALAEWFRPGRTVQRSCLPQRVRWAPVVLWIIQLQQDRSRILTVPTGRRALSWTRLYLRFRKRPSRVT